MYIVYLLCFFNVKAQHAIEKKPLRMVVRKISNNAFLRMPATVLVLHNAKKESRWKYAVNSKFDFSRSPKIRGSAFNQNVVYGA